MEVDCVRVKGEEDGRGFTRVWMEGAVLCGKERLFYLGHLGMDKRLTGIRQKTKKGDKK